MLDGRRTTDQCPRVCLHPPSPRRRSRHAIGRRKATSTKRYSDSMTRMPPPSRLAWLAPTDAGPSIERKEVSPLPTLALERGARRAGASGEALARVPAIMEPPGSPGDGARLHPVLSGGLPASAIATLPRYQLGSLWGPGPGGQHRHPVPGRGGTKRDMAYCASNTSFTWAWS